MTYCVVLRDVANCAATYTARSQQLFYGHDNNNNTTANNTATAPVVASTSTADSVAQSHTQPTASYKTSCLVSNIYIYIYKPWHTSLIAMFVFAYV